MSMTVHFMHIRKLCSTVYFLINTKKFCIFKALVKAMNVMRNYNEGRFFVVIYTISGVSTAFLDNLYYIITTRAILGISLAALMTCGLELISQYFCGHERNKVLASQTTVMSLGSIVFTLVSGYLCDINWRYAFMLYFTGLALLPFVIIFLQDSQSGEKNGNNAINIDTNVGYFGKIFGERLPMLICIIAFVNMICFYMIPIQIPFVLKKINPDISGKMISLVITVEVIISAFFATKYKRLKKNRTFESIFAISFAIMAIAYFGLSYSKSYNAILFFVAFYGLGMALIMPNNIIWIINSVNNKNRAMWIGLMTTGIYLGKFVSPIILIPIIENFGMLKSYRVVAVLMLFVAIFVSFIAGGIQTTKHFKPHYKNYNKRKKNNNDFKLGDNIVQ